MHLPHRLTSQSRKAPCKTRSTENPSINCSWSFTTRPCCIFSAGETEFLITANGEKIGYGTLAPFALPSLSSTSVDGTFQTDNTQLDKSESVDVKINGVTKYDMIVTSIDVPFVFHPTEEQAREFIHQN